MVCVFVWRWSRLRFSARIHKWNYQNWTLFMFLENNSFASIGWVYWIDEIYFNKQQKYHHRAREIVHNFQLKSKTISIPSIFSFINFFYHIAVLLVFLDSIENNNSFIFVENAANSYEEMRLNMKMWIFLLIRLMFQISMFHWVTQWIHEDLMSTFNSFVNTSHVFNTQQDTFIHTHDWYIHFRLTQSPFGVVNVYV